MGADEMAPEVTFLVRLIVALGARKSRVHSAFVFQVMYQTLFVFVCLHTLITLEAIQSLGLVS